MLHASTQKLVKKLHELTIQGAVAWKEGEERGVLLDTEGYRVEAASNPAYIRLSTVSGRVLETAEEAELQETKLESGETFSELIIEMAEEGMRYAKGTEQAIHAILDAAELGALSRGLDDPHNEAKAGFNAPITDSDNQTMTDAVDDLVDRINRGETELAPPDVDIVEEEIAGDDTPVVAEEEPQQKSAEILVEPEPSSTVTSSEQLITPVASDQGENGDEPAELTGASHPEEAAAVSMNVMEPPAQPPSLEPPQVNVVEVHHPAEVTESSQFNQTVENNQNSAPVMQEPAVSQELPPPSQDTNAAPPFASTLEHPAQEAFPGSPTRAEPTASDERPFFATFEPVDAAPETSVANEAAPTAPGTLPAEPTPLPQSAPASDAIVLDQSEPPPAVGFQQPVLGQRGRPQDEPAEKFGGLKKVTSLGLALGKDNGTTITGVPEDINRRAEDRQESSVTSTPQPFQPTPQTEAVPPQNSNGNAEQPASASRDQSYKPWG